MDIWTNDQYKLSTKRPREQLGGRRNPEGTMEDEGRLTVSSDFGNLLRRHRLAAGLSQEALAERARMSSFAISALERGHRRRPQRETLALLIAALALDEKQREEFEAAARRSRVPIPLGTNPVARDPPQEPTTSNPSLAQVQIGPFQASLSRPARPTAVVVILAIALGAIGVINLERSTENAGTKISQVVTELGPFQFDVSPFVRSKVAVTPIGTLPANTIFMAKEGQTVEVACNEGTRYRATAIRRLSDAPAKPLPLRYKLIIDGKPEDTYTVGTKFLIDVEKVGTSGASHTLGIDPLDTLPNSTMTFSCVTIVHQH